MQKTKTRVPFISTFMDGKKCFGEKTKDEIICRSKSAEGISSRNKYDEMKNRLALKSKITKSPSAGNAIR